MADARDAQEENDQPTAWRVLLVMDLVTLTAFPCALAADDRRPRVHAILPVVEKEKPERLAAAIGSVAAPLRVATASAGRDALRPAATVSVRLAVN